MNQKELLEKKESELKTKVEEYNNVVQQIQKLQQTLNEIGQDIVRLEGGIKTLKELDKQDE